MTVRTFRLLELAGGDFSPSDVSIEIDDFSLLDWPSTTQLAALQPLDPDLTAIAALSTSSFGRSLLTQADASAARTTLGAGTSSFSGVYTDLSSIPSTFTPAAHTQAFSTLTSTPTTLSGYGITDSQPLDTELTALAGLTSAADKLPYFTGSGTAGVTTFTTAGRSLVDDADSTAMRSTLGLGTLATQSGTFSGTTSGTNTGDQTTVSGNAGTATALETSRTINGTSFDGTTNITVAAAGSTLTGSSLASNILSSSLTSVGILTGGSTGAGFTLALTTSTLTGTLPAAQMPALSGDITTSSGAVATSLASGVVSLAKMAPLTNGTLIGNNTGVPATPLALSASSVKTLLAISTSDVSGLGTLATQSGTFSGTHSGTSSGTNTGDQTVTLSGDASGSGTGAITVTVAYDILRTPTSDISVSSDSSLIVLRRFALSTGRKLSLITDSIMRIQI